MLFIKKIKAAFMNPQFQTDVVKPLSIEGIIDQEVAHLSGGELQRVAIILCLGTPADIYLIDEPSAYLDSEQRIIAAKVIKRYILHFKRTAFIVEHDFIMATYLADRVVVYDRPSLGAYSAFHCGPNGCEHFEEIPDKEEALTPNAPQVRIPVGMPQ